MAYTIRSLGFGQVAVLQNGKHVKKFGGPSAPQDARMFINKQHQDSLPKERAPGLKDRQVAEEMFRINSNIESFNESMLEEFSEDEINEMIEKYEGFEKLTGELKAKGAKSPEALAAWIGRKKYGKKKFQKMAEETIDEKKLTPAELKKREEIAQAIGRENTKMEMGKKMAIATAQAKKVAEAKDDWEPEEETKEPEAKDDAELKQASKKNTEALAKISKAFSKKKVDEERECEEEGHEDEKEDKDLVKKMVKKSALKTEGFADQFFDGEIIRVELDIPELQEADKNYDAYFKACMKKAGISSIADLKSEDEKKEFMNKVDAGFSAKNEDVLYEEFVRADIDQSVQQHRQAGHKVEGIVHKIYQGKPYAEYTVTMPDGVKKKYIYHGNIRRQERVSGE